MTFPTGSVTFVFTDIEGSTAMLQRLGRDGFLAILETHNELVRSSFDAGTEIRTEGDAFFYVFPDAGDAVDAAERAQASLADHDWPDGGMVRVRIGMHTGEGVLGGGDYVGLDVHRAARVSSAAHGGQVLLTKETLAAAGPVPTVDLGTHRFKNIDEPEHIHQLVGAGPRIDYPPIRSLTVRPNNLPSHISEFVGRSSEVTDVAELLERSRLVTVTGPGGTGKTRLATQVASTVLSRYNDGVVYVPLEALATDDLVTPAIAAALELDMSADDILQAVIDDLGARSTLLVLDNFEHVVGAASVVVSIIESARDVDVLVTSQALLRVRGEHAYPLAPMSGNDGIDLFVARAQAVDPSFDPSEGDQKLIGEIVEMLEGMPLATELTAARIRLFGLAGLRDRVASHLEFADTSADRPDRHRTTNAAISWSYDLLKPTEQRALRHLSVFDGGFTLDAAEAVVGASAIEDVASLLDKSLLTSKVELGEARFSMLDSVGRFAAELLDPAERAEAESRHARYFGDLGARARPLLEGSSQQEWMRRLSQEHNNLRAVVRRALAEQTPDDALLAVGSTWRYFHRRGHIVELSRWLDDLLKLPGASLRARAEATDALAATEYWNRRMDDSIRHYESVLQMFLELGDRERVGDIYFALSAAVNFSGDLDQGQIYGELAIESYEAAGKPDSVRKVRSSEAFRTWLNEGPEVAVEAFAAARDSFAEAGDLLEALQTEIGLSAIRYQLGDEEAAFRGALSTLEQMRAIDDVPGSIGLVGLTASLLAEKRPNDALQLGAAADALSERIGGVLQPSDYQFAPAHERLVDAMPPDQLAEAERLGRTLSLDEAADLAMGLLAEIAAENTSAGHRE